MANENAAKPGKAVTARVFAEVEKNVARLDRGLTVDELREFGVQDELIRLAMAVQAARANGVSGV